MVEIPDDEAKTLKHQWSFMLMMLASDRREEAIVAAYKVQAILDKYIPDPENAVVSSK